MSIKADAAIWDKCQVRNDFDGKAVWMRVIEAVKDGKIRVLVDRIMPLSRPPRPIS